MRMVEESCWPAGRSDGPVAAEVGAGPLVRALRLAAGPGCWPLIGRAFRDICGPVCGTAACHLFRVLLQGLALGARRPLRLGFVGAPELTHDERAVLQMIAAAQRDHIDLVTASARWLARPAVADALARTAFELAEVLAANGLRLSAELPVYTRQRPPAGLIAAVES